MTGVTANSVSSSKDTIGTSTIRWSGIQQALEETVADTLILMDTAYYPSSAMATKAGVFELISAAASQDHLSDLGRGTFSQALAEQLRARAAQDKSLTAAELHSVILSKYPKLVQDRSPEKEIVTSFPLPFHLQTSKDPRLPSILLAPLPATRGPPHAGLPRAFGGEFSGSGNGSVNESANGHSHGGPFSGDVGVGVGVGVNANGSGNGVGAASSPAGPMRCLNLLIPDNALELDNWVEWLKAMPGGVRDISVDRVCPSLSYH